MALATRSERASAVRARVSTTRPGARRGTAADARAMVKRTAPVAHLAQPKLVLVPRRKRTARMIAMASTVLWYSELRKLALRWQVG